MASKKERKRQERREKEREYSESFLARLAGADTVAAAENIARQAMPHVNDIGRLRHTNLIHLLSSIEATRGEPPFRVLRNQPLPPGRATQDERVAYSSFFRRLARSREISAEDAEYAIQRLSSDSISFVDFI